MQFSISHCYYSEKTNMRRLRITGAVISATIANLNGLLGHADRYLLGRAMPRCKRACTGIAFLRSPVQNGTGQAGELVPMGNVNLIVRCRVDSYTLVYSGIGLWKCFALPQQRAGGESNDGVAQGNSTRRCR